jgi:hypothetical protein
MIIPIINPFAGHKVGWTWAQHQAAIDPATGRHYLGGTDYEVPAGVTVVAAADGRAIRRDANTVSIVLADGRSITYREMRSVDRTGSWNVKLGDPIAVTGRVVGGVTKWPHIEAMTPAGVRVPFEPLVTGTSTAGTGTTTPVPIPAPKSEEFDMTEIKYYWKDEGGIAYGIFGMELPGGSRTSTNTATATAWGKLYGQEGGDTNGAPWEKLTAAIWATLEAEAKAINTAWVAQQKAIAASSTENAPEGIDYTALAAALAKVIPSAADNAKAARAAIVAPA